MNDQMRCVPVVFSGWNNRAIIAFCRFCKSANIPCFIVAKNQSDPILLTEYKANVFKVRANDSLTTSFFVEVYSELTEKGNFKLVLMPTTEYLNRFFLSNRSELEGMGYIIPLCDGHLYDTISDKAEFEKLCRSYGISTPKEYSEISENNLPFVIKPKNYFFGGGLDVAEKPKLVMNHDEFEKLGMVDMNNYYCQEFVGGTAFYLLYYFANDGSYSVYSQKNMVQQHGGLSIVAAESSDYHMDPRADAFTKLFIDVGFHGLVMVEIRDYNGHFYMIEANPRFWGPSQLILDSGMDIFDRFAIDCGFMEKRNRLLQYKSKTKYFWLGGIYNTSSLKEKCAFLSNYNANLLNQDFALWCNADIYKRFDTLLVFLSEIAYSSDN